MTPPSRRAAARRASYNDAVISHFLGIFLAASPAAAAPSFHDVTRDAGLAGLMLRSGSPEKDYILETLGTGVAAFDFDNDGWQDLAFASGSSAGEEDRAAGVRLFRSRGDGTFEDVTRGSGMETRFWGFGMAAGDYDNDGLTDLYVTAWGPNRLFRNLGGGRFEDVSDRAGVADARWGASAAFADIDHDGLIDLYVANYVDFDPARVPRRGDPQRPCYYRGAMVMCGPTGLAGSVDVLYRNNGDGTFTDVTRAAGIRTDIGMFGLGVAAADYDADGDVDLYVANDATPNQLYRNRGDGTFEEIGALSGVAYGTDGTEQGSMGTAFGDFDGDARLDLVVTNFSHQFYQIFRWAEDDFFEDITFTVGLAEATWLRLGWATDFVDFDNDGDLDLFFANGHVYPGVNAMQIGTTYTQRNQILRNDPAPDGGRVLVDITDAAGPGLAAEASYRAGGAADLDRDGDMDLIVTVIDGPAVLLRNDASGGASVTIRLVGRRANRSALGARVTARPVGPQTRPMLRLASGGGSYLWASDARVHIGLGAARAASLEIAWPGGAVQRVGEIAAGAEYLIVEGEAPQRLRAHAAP